MGAFAELFDSGAGGQTSAQTRVPHPCVARSTFYMVYVVCYANFCVHNWPLMRLPAKASADKVGMELDEMTLLFIDQTMQACRL